MSAAGKSHDIHSQKYRFPRTAIAAFSEADRQSALDARDLDLYLFNRDARMGEVSGFERAGTAGLIGSDPIRPATAPRVGRFFRALNRALLP